jgi:tetratricopeptide (TPR) repeat protein
MVRTCVVSLLCLGFLLILAPGRLPANPPADEDSALRNWLALQRAMESARFLMLAGDTKKAVDVLEEQLPRVNGNSGFLRLLREAYRGRIKDLWLANNAPEAKRHLERLCILEPTANQDASLRPPETTVKVTPGEPKVGPLSNLPAKFFPNWALNSAKKDSKTAGAPAKPTTVRGKVENVFPDDDPFAPANMRPGSGAGAATAQARQLLSKAEDEFARRRFPEARALFEQAYQADRSCLDNSRDRWAYCMLNQVVDQLNQPGQTRPALANLEQQVQGAIALAPILEQEGKRLLREIDQRQKTQAAAGSPESAAQLAVHHWGRNKEGWQVAETRYFKVFHKQSREQIENVAAIAEKTRRDMYRKWFGTDEIDWSPKCELILHPTGNDYSRMTGESGASPGHSRIERDPSGQRIVGRRMDLRCDNPGMLEAVLPHETTHIVLAGMFDNHHVPRWADEGIAVLTEPSFKVDQHRRNLEKGQQEGLLFEVQELMQLDNYPQPRRISAFYAESVCLVEFMTELHGPQVFTAFVRDGLREGYGPALRKHYGMDMPELQQRWQQRLGQANRVASAP